MVQKIHEDQKRAKRSFDDEPAPDVVKKFGSVVRRHYLEQTDARFRLAANTEYPFHERLVHFWSNHFAVSADKPPVSALAGLFENVLFQYNLN